jgi:hypothetical protein
MANILKRVYLPVLQEYIRILMSSSAPEKSATVANNALLMPGKQYVQ